MQRKLSNIHGPSSECRLKLEFLGIGTVRIHVYGILNSNTVVALDDHISNMK
jgi:hypothetical protein